MTATATRKPRSKPARRVQISKPCNGVYALAMTIGTGEKAKHYGYYVRRIPADFGLAFHFEKFQTEQEEGKDSEYDVNLDLQHGQHTCTCKGNTYCGHCKHVEATLALIQSGKIDVPAAKPEAKPQAQKSTCFECGCQVPHRQMYCEGCSYL